jgi:hypothetical protein
MIGNMVARGLVSSGVAVVEPLANTEVDASAAACFKKALRRLGGWASFYSKEPPRSFDGASPIRTILA